MSAYIPPTEDIRFLLTELFDFDAQMASLPGHEEISADLVVDVLEEAGKFCTEVLAPLNRSGDEEGCRLDNGQVSTPRGLAAAYRAFADAGWCALSGDPRYGGQGLPRTAQILLDEILSSTNLSFGLFPGLTRGAVETLLHHASADLKAQYLPKMISGEWTGAMALTEAGAGSDLGLLTARAEPRDDGSYTVTGTKIFISSGDHDFGGNIIHLVLARLPDAAPGVRGISLFLVPKFLPTPGGDTGTFNHVSAGALEHKMGIHAQPTCVMNYDGATGWLVGEPGRGLNAMFTMMNAERLFVGIQGLGIGEAAHQKAVAYARERQQGRSPDGTRAPVAIIEHPDVRKMLLTGRALTDAGRALAVWTALQMDMAAYHPDSDTRRLAEGFVSLLTPVIKAAFTDFGFETAVLSQQVFGGHGYIREWGMEQYVRDARITQIYEGTNGIQAMDLVGRKLQMENGELPHRFFALMQTDLQNAAQDTGSASLAEAVTNVLQRLKAVTRQLQADSHDIATLGSAATDYLRLFALVSYGWLWVRMAQKSQFDETPLKRQKQAVARFFVAKLLPQSLALEAAILSGSKTLMQPAI